MSMMGIKNGTKAYSNSTGEPNLMSTNGTKTNSATDLAKMGDENVGDLLNKLSDPNWIDPTKKVRTVGNDKMDKDSFMKLMITQMKNQDPMNPMQSHELAAQLAQFSSVEQLQNVNQTLTEMKASQKPTETFQALNFIGKSVMGDSAKVTRLKGDREHEFNFTLPADAKETTIKVRNANGEVVRTVNLKDLKKGENSFRWNGLDERGNSVITGEYQFLAEATDGIGKKLAIKTDFEGMITGVNFASDGPVLLVGQQSVKLKDVKKIVDPSLMKNDQKIKNESRQDLLNKGTQVNNGRNAGKESQKDSQADSVPKAMVASETVTNDTAAKEPEPTMPNNLMTDVGMSREMIERLQKETRPDSSTSTIK